VQLVPFDTTLLIIFVCSFDIPMLGRPRESVDLDFPGVFFFFFVTTSPFTPHLPRHTQVSFFFLMVFQWISRVSLRDADYRPLFPLELFEFWFVETAPRFLARPVNFSP